MPIIKPFAGIRYDPAAVDLGRVVAPPYDVIDPSLREALERRDPRNIVRLILSSADDPYGAAARELEAWRGAGVLRRDGAPAIYLLEQQWDAPGAGRRRRTGFIAACLLEEFGGSVLPHEKTHSGPKEDRLRLMRATGMMFSQIFALYADPAGELDRLFSAARAGPPAAEALHEGVLNRLWVCSEESAVLAAGEFLRARPVLIADGHHRYETALAYRNHSRLTDPAHRGHEPYNFVPMFFANQHDPGVVVLPTHRLLHSMPGFDPPGFLRRLGEYFAVEEDASPEALAESIERGPGGELGLVFPGETAGRRLRPKPAATALLDGLPEVIARLDVTLLHAVVLERILGLSAESQERKEHLEYERDLAALLRRLRTDGRSRAAFLVQAPPVEQVRRAAEAGQTLPQKSTYFYPKLLSGLVSYAAQDGGRW